MIKIGDKKSKLTSVYKIILYFMSGDADSYHEEEFIIPKNHKDLLDFCEFLSSCLKVGSKRKYSDIKNFDRFTDEEECDNRGVLILRFGQSSLILGCLILTAGRMMCLAAKPRRDLKV